MPLVTCQIGPCFAAKADGMEIEDLIVDDLVMWDNRRTMHRGRPFPAHEPRDMRRTTLVGDGPTVAQAV